jgi:DNA-binding CsgD family transcriptional regulator
LLHAVLGFSILALAMGTAVVTLSLLASVRFSSVGFRQLASVTGAALIIMIVDLIKEYDRAVPADMAARLLPLYAVLSALGFGLFAYSLLALVLQVAGKRFTGALQAAVIAIGVVFAFCGVWREVTPGAASAAAVVVGMTGVQAYGLAVLGASLPRIGNSHIRQLCRSILIAAPPLLLIVIAQFAAEVTGTTPLLFDDLPIAQLLLLLVIEGILLAYGLRFLFRPEPAAASILPEQFVTKYSISPRECDIISMIMQGYSNRMIGEKLFISALTVKNHIYHIYQKTSAENKIHLINLINSLK